MSIKKMLEKIPTMTPADREKLRRLLDAFEGEASAERAQEGEALVYAVIYGQLQTIGLSPPPLAVWRARGSNYRHFKQGATTLLSYITNHLHPENPREFRKAVLVCVKVLIARLDRDGVEVSLGSLGVNLQRVPALMDDAYPGYRESNMLKWVVQKYRIT